MKYTDYNVQKIETLARKAAAGNAAALDELRKLNQLQVNNTVRRMKTFKKDGITSPAMTRMESLMKNKGIKNLSKSKKLDVETLKNQILITRKFLNAKTGTVKGAMQYRDEEIARLAKKNIIVTKDQFYTDWRDFLSSDLFKEFSKFDSGRALMEMHQVLKEGKRTLEDLKKAWEKYLNDELSLIEAWKDFTQI